MLAGDSAVEFYRFLYNASNKLAKVTTSLDPIDNLPISVATNDTLTYDAAGNLEGFTRRSPDVAKTGTFTFEFGQNGTEQLLSTATFQGQMYNLYASCNDGGRDSNICGGFTKQLGYSTNPTIGMLDQLTLGRSSSETLTDERFKGDSSCDCQRELDTFFFHPLMILRDEVPEGGLLLWIYAIDWWRPGTATINGQSLSKNDQVTITLNYGR